MLRVAVVRLLRLLGARRVEAHQGLELQHPEEGDEVNPPLDHEEHPERGADDVHGFGLAAHVDVEHGLPRGEELRDVVAQGEEEPDAVSEQDRGVVDVAPPPQGLKSCI